MSIQLVVMGVSGCGKSTLGLALAQRWGLPFIEGDRLHGPENVAKMTSGTPLTDEDRWPWLDRIGAALAAEAGQRQRGIASCSALRRAYRDRLREGVGRPLRFLMIDLPPGVLVARMAARTGHFMPPALLESQLRTLERPFDEPDVVVVDGTKPIDQLIALVEAYGTSTDGWLSAGAL